MYIYIYTYTWFKMVIFDNDIVNIANGCSKIRNSIVILIKVITQVIQVKGKRYKININHECVISVRLP